MFEIIDDLGQGCKIVAAHGKLYRVHLDLFGEIDSKQLTPWNMVEQVFEGGEVRYPNLKQHLYSGFYGGGGWITGSVLTPNPNLVVKISAI